MDTEKRVQNQSGAHEECAKAPSVPTEKPSIVQIDPAASAALALAIRSAKQGLRPPNALLKQIERLQPNILRKTAGRWVSVSSVLAQAAVAVVLIGAGWFASYMGTLANQDAIHRLEAETSRSQEILARLSGDLASLKGTLATFKDVEHTSSVSSASGQAKLAEKVERLAVAVQDPGKKITALENKLDRMESQIMANLAGLAAKPPAPAAPAAEPAARGDAGAAKPAKNEPVDGWIVREVYKGAALVEGQNRRLYEVMPGGVIPGVGRVEAIERRGKNWVVLTDKGIIGTYR